MAAVLLGACTADSVPAVSVEVRAHWTPGCGPDENSPDPTFDLQALGDFPASSSTSESITGTARREPLVIPGDTEAVVVEATNGFGRWAGVGSVSGDTLDVALSPLEEACPLFAAVDGYPGRAGAQALGVSSSARVALLAGGAGSSTESSGAVAINLGTGEGFIVESGLNARRAHATVTEFGHLLLVAGGEDGQAHATADVFDPDRGIFEQPPLDLESGRSRHAALTLPSGETLLIGGRDEDGRALSTLEAVSPESRRFRLRNLADLQEARIDPSALRLDTGRILVAGGVDSDDRPIATLEWLAPDASDHVLSTDDLGGAPADGRAYVAMPGGAALGVGGCTARVSGPGSECSDPSDAVIWISAEAEVTVLPQALPIAVSDPHLVGASGGRPWLLAKIADESIALRFDPWRAAFVQPSRTPAPAPGRDAPAPVQVDPGFFLWLGQSTDIPTLFGYRHDVRGPLSRDVAPLILSGNEHLAPNRLPSEATVAYDDQSRTVSLISDRAALVVTDTIYADLFLEMAVREGPPPRVRLGLVDVGDESCPWPEPPEPPYTAAISRTGQSATLMIGEHERACPTSGERVQVQLFGTGTLTVLSSLSLRRSAD